MYEKISMTKIFAIVNVTPDSFSGDGVSPRGALEKIKRAIEEGADVVDIGAESTRPGATPLTDAGELARIKAILPQAVALCRQNGVKISLDSYRYASVSYALECGIDIVNDVTGGGDESVVRAVAEAKNVDYVFMHSLGVPADKFVTIDSGADVVTVLKNWRQEKERTFIKAGIEADRLIFDPGIGFGKTAKQSRDIIARANELRHGFTTRVLFGHSRKSFLGMAEATREEKDAATLEISHKLAAEGRADFIRVHNVKIHADAIENART